MKIKLELSHSLYDAAVCIEDAYGRRDFILRVMEEQGVRKSETEVAADGFTITILPLFLETREMVEEVFADAKGWKEKLIEVFVKGIVGVTRFVPLRVACQYRISGITEGTTLTICGGGHLFGTKDVLDLLQMVPVIYTFESVRISGGTIKLLDAWPLERGKFLNMARVFTVAHAWWVSMFFYYPFQMIRARRLSRKKKIRRIVKKFVALSEEEQQQRLKQQIKWFEAKLL